LIVCRLQRMLMMTLVEHMMKKLSTLVWKLVSYWPKHAGNELRQGCCLANSFLVGTVSADKLLDVSDGLLYLTKCKKRRLQRKLVVESLSQSD